MKKVISILLSITLFVVLSSCAFAEANTAQIEPRYIPCSSGGKHFMYCIGNATVYSGPYTNPGTILKERCPVQQCSKCGILFVSEWDPDFYGFPGYYTIGYSGNNFQNISSSYIVYGGWIGECVSPTEMISDPLLAGFEFKLY